jgi:glycosyltransferase involved in cell wall biosynthesis
MRIAVYDRHWATAGGGEKFAGGIAQVLSDRHEMTLLAHEPVDTDWLSERLALDLSKVSVEVVGDAGRLEPASAEHDVLINASFHSSERNGAAHGLYVVHFPHDPFAALSPRLRRVVRTLGPRLGAAGVEYSMGPGFFTPDVVAAGKVWWTDGDAELRVPVEAGRRTTVRLFFGALVPNEVEVNVRVALDGREVGALTVTAARSKKDVVVPTIVKVPVVGHRDGSPVLIRLRSNTWTPAEVLGNDDGRDLGVPLTGVAVGSHPLALARGAVSLFESYPPSLGFLDTYDRILANSRFTRRWIRAYWNCDADLLYPPVTLREPALADVAATGTRAAPKQPIILSVGRFFDAEGGHSKKQVEMVRAFARLVASGAAAGWSLHLVGGCRDAHRPYLEQVRAEAAGLPVELHIDASGEAVDDLYRRASIYWHAAGLGEDADAHPDRLEHFGITTVEAMSAGAVPVAYAEAGPLEAFTHGVEGYHFRTPDQLIDETAGLIADPARLASMGAAARHRAESFGMDAFAGHVNRVVDEVVSEASTR